MAGLRPGHPRSVSHARRKGREYRHKARHDNALPSRELRRENFASTGEKLPGETPMPLAYFVVRATVPDAAKRAAFDEWYSREHLPDATKAFGVNKAWRFWSVHDPALHQAMYEFSDQAALERATGGDALKPLVAEFDRC